MTWYTFFKSVHVAPVAVWFGGALTIQAFAFRILLLSRCELVVLLTVIVNMVVKPTGNAGWFWGLLVAMVAGIAAVLAVSRRGTSAVPSPATE